mgnify:CR=1 FL=1
MTYVSRAVESSPQEQEYKGEWSVGDINNIVCTADDLARRHALDEQAARILEELTGQGAFFERYIPFLEYLIDACKCAVISPLV